MMFQALVLLFAVLAGHVPVSLCEHKEWLRTWSLVSSHGLQVGKRFTARWRVTSISEFEILNSILFRAGDAMGLTARKGLCSYAHFASSLPLVNTQVSLFYCLRLYMEFINSNISFGWGQLDLRKMNQNLLVMIDECVQ